jgi:hypothetical protein
MEQNQKKLLIEALTQVALLESKKLYACFAEIIAYLKKQEYLAALGTLAGLEDKFKFVDTVLKVAAKVSQQ